MKQNNYAATAIEKISKDIVKYKRLNLDTNVISETLLMD